MRHATLVLSLSLLGSVLAAPAAAQDSHDAEARGLFEAGRVAFDDGRYDDALGHFEQAHALSGRPTLLFNIGMAQERLRLDDEALASYRRYLAERPDADNREFVERRIAVLEGAHRRAPSPAEVAAAAEPDREPAPASEPSDGGVVTRWWFWTLLATVAAGATVGIVLATRGGDPQPFQGNVCAPGEVSCVVEALSAP